MKHKFSLIILSILLAVFSSLKDTQTAYANNEYSRILSSDTYFYFSDNGQDHSFVLPYSYYVKVIEVGTTYTQIEYGNSQNSNLNIEGYILTSKLNITDNQPIDPFPSLTVTTSQTSVIYHDTAMTIKSTLCENATCSYLGSKQSGGINYVYAYIESNDSFAFIKASSLLSFTCPPHATPIETKSSDLNSESKLNNNNQNSLANSLQVIIILGISIISISIVYILFKPNSSKITNQIFDQYGDDES